MNTRLNTKGVHPNVALADLEVGDVFRKRRGDKLYRKTQQTNSAGLACTCVVSNYVNYFAETIEVVPAKELNMEVVF